MPPSDKIPWRGLLASIAVLAALAAGLYLGGHPDKLPDRLQDIFVEDDTAVTSEAADLIRDNFAKKVSDERLQNGSLRGMVESLNDRFSHYFSPRESRLFREAVGGQFSGIGLTVIEHKRGLQVSGVYKDTPAKRAGIRPGDVILKVNGESIAGEPSELATAKIKGPPGTSVRLTVLRPSTGRDRLVTLKRARITIPVVAGSIRTVGDKRLGVVTIASFTSGVHAQLRQELRRLKDRGAEGFVIDLRQNGGGLLDEAVLVSSTFIRDGVIVSTRGRKSLPRVLNATGGAMVRDPVVVLVDRGTASASEIVTAALHERLGSKVVGRRTFGKGVFGQVFDLPNGGSLDLTLGNYYTPTGRNLGGKGILPDVPARDDPQTEPDEALQRALGVLQAESAKKQREKG
jgi:carboxyl-terminal processing protease